MVGPASDLSTFHLYSIRRFGIQLLQACGIMSAEYQDGSTPDVLFTRRPFPSRGADPSGRLLIFPEHLFGSGMQWIPQQILLPFRSAAHCSRHVSPVFLPLRQLPYRHYIIYNYSFYHLCPSKGRIPAVPETARNIHGGGLFIFLDRRWSSGIHGEFDEFSIIYPYCAMYGH
ncbi:hypothetical protein J2741_000085 [Methanolinea mesophila]|nr:hypothetical protein [Methanolinea mesophila]